MPNSVFCGGRNGRDWEFLIRIAQAMVGDSVYDFEGAVKVGVDFIGVLYGFGFKKEDVEFYSSKIEFIREPKELLNLVTTEIVK